MAVDGSIIIDTRIDAKGMNTGVKGIAKSLNGILGIVKNIARFMTAAFIGGEILGFFRSMVQGLDLMNSSIGDKLKPLADAFSTLKGAFINLLVNALIPMIPYIVSAVQWLTNMLSTVTQVVAALFGMKQTIGGITTGLKKTTKEAKSAVGALAAFDQLNVLQKTDTPETPEAEFTTPEPLVISDEAQRIVDEILKTIQELKDIWTDIWKGDLSSAGNKFLDFVFWEEWKNFFKGLWAEVLKWWDATDIGGWIKALRENFIKSWRAIIENTIDTFRKTKENIIKILEGIKEFLVSVFTGDWEGAWKALKDIVATVFDTLETWVQGVLTNISIFIEGFANGMQLMFGPIIDWIAEKIGSMPGLINGALAVIQGSWGTLAKWFLENVWNPIENGFGSALTGIKQGFEKTFGSIKTFVKGVLNNIIDSLNDMIEGVVHGINSVIAAANAVGEMVGLPEINYVDAPKIPRLATGAVIPPNSEFLAVLGDQRSGTNIEAPADLIRQILREELGNAGGEVSVTIPLILDGEKIYQNQKRISLRHGTSLIKG